MSLLRRRMGLAIFRYVDDLFEVELAPLAAAAAAAREALLAFAGLLGLTLIKPKTLGLSLAMPVLGVAVSLLADSVAVSLSEDKLAFWVDTLEEALASPTGLRRRGAQKAAGRLAIGCAAVLRSAPRLGESVALRRDLEWWLMFLCERKPSRRHVAPPMSPPVLPYTDAEGRSGAGAIPVRGRSLAWWAADLACLRQDLAPHATHINAYELVAILVALHSWGLDLAGPHVLILVDNHAVEHVAAAGTSGSADFARLAHGFGTSRRSSPSTRA